MKKAYKMFKYSAETQNGVVARANTIENIERIARKQMFLYKIVEEVTIFDGNTVVKRITL